MLLPINKSIFYSGRIAFAEKVLMQHQFEISLKKPIIIAMVSYYFGSKERMLEALIIYRATDQDAIRYFTNGKPRSIAKKLIN
jgi:hypothetical protein